MINRIIMITAIVISVCILLLVFIYILNSFDESINNSMENIPIVSDNFTKSINTVIPTNNSKYKVYKGLIDGRIFKDNIYISKNPKLNYSTCAKFGTPISGYTKANVSNCDKSINNNYYHNSPLQYKLSNPIVPYSHCYWDYKRIGRLPTDKTKIQFKPSDIKNKEILGSNNCNYPYYNGIYKNNKGETLCNWPDKFDPKEYELGQSLCEPHVVDIPYHCENVDSENPICYACGAIDLGIDSNKFLIPWKDPKTRPKECIVNSFYVNNTNLPNEYGSDINKIWTYLPRTVENINWRCHQDASLYTPYANYMYSPYSKYSSCNTGIANLPNITSITKEMEYPFYGGKILGDNNIDSIDIYKNEATKLIDKEYCLDKKNWPEGYDIATYDDYIKKCTLQKFGNINAKFIIPDILD